MKQVKEFKSCIEYELEDGSHTFRCKGCGKDFPSAKSASHHSSNCYNFILMYDEDYERFEEEIIHYYIEENLNKGKVCELLHIDVHFFDELINVLNIEKSTELQKKCRSRDLKISFQEKYGVDNPFQLDSVKSKIKNTNMKKYGVDNPSQSEIVKQKKRESCINHYGVDSHLKSEEIINQIRETNLKKYGKSSTLQVPEFREKARLTNMKKYGTLHPLQSSEVQEKQKSTCIEKYGVDNVSKSDVVKEKRRLTFQKRYGVNNPFRSPSILERIANTNLSKYGCINPFSNPDVKDKIKETCMEKYGVPYHCMTQKCIEAQGHIISKINQHFHQFLLDKGIESEFEFTIENRSYDFHILNSNILIEINPTYTHNSAVGPVFSSHQREPLPFDYHRMKTQVAKSNGYHCIHIFDWEDWNKIAGLISPNKKRIYARNCILKEVSESECHKFLEKYHLQNSCKGQSVRLGLYYKDELVQLMTFGKPRYNKNYQWELLRYCSNSDYIIVGGSQKLFKKFIDKYNPESIISYCDTSKFNGNVYQKLGFVFKTITNPTAHWFNGSRHITDMLLRQRGADQLIGTNYGKGTNNAEIMIKYGYLPVYDCGQSVYQWTK